MAITDILIAIGEALFKLYPAVEQYGPQIVTDLQQDWEAVKIIIQQGGVPTQEQHDRIMANLDRAHQEFQANTADADVA